MRQEEILKSKDQDSQEIEKQDTDIKHKTRQRNYQIVLCDQLRERVNGTQSP